jgi:hypothetical protein
MSEREIQEELVGRFQPLNGSATRNWPTPDPWQAGRLFRRKADQDELLALASEEDDEDVEADEAIRRVECAQWRRAERIALEAARRRARTQSGVLAEGKLSGAKSPGKSAGIID